jgi:ubiquinone/menaquinone biosynthesis C-methylase UbiE
MVKPRVQETGEGIQDEFTVELYDQLQRRLRDKGYMETDSIIKTGIDTGLALEVGPGPGYLGLEWLSKTQGTTLKGLEISQNMIEMATKNAEEYGLQDRISFTLGDAQDMPFEDSTFDAVFSNGSLHEWDKPKKICNEMYRVLKPGGRYFVSDLRRDMNPLFKWLMKASTKPKEIKPGLISSINAAYTKDEIEELLADTDVEGYKVENTVAGLIISGRKPDGSS